MLSYCVNFVYFRPSRLKFVVTISDEFIKTMLLCHALSLKVLVIHLWSVWKDKEIIDFCLTIIILFSLYPSFRLFQASFILYPAFILLFRLLLLLRLREYLVIKGVCTRTWSKARRWKIRSDIYMILTIYLTSLKLNQLRLMKS